MPFSVYIIISSLIFRIFHGVFAGHSEKSSLSVLFRFFLNAGTKGVKVYTFFPN